MHVTLVARKKGSGVIEAKHRLIQFLRDQAIEFSVDDHPNTLDALESLDQVSTVSLDTVQDGLIVSLGGDGSLLRLIGHASKHQLPLVGVNLGRVGFLTDLSMDDLTGLVDILHGEGHEDKRCLLEVCAESDPTQQLGVALNDIMICAETPGKNLDFTVTIDDSHTFSHRADGFLVSTPTGSTAYALSAGGPIIHPDLDVHLLTPICSHRLSTRPLITPPTTKIMIKIGALVNRKAVLCSDGTPLMHLESGASILIQRAQQQLRMLHPQGYHFFRAAQNKLHWEYA